MTEAACCWCGWCASDLLKALGGVPLGAPLGVHSRRHANKRQSGARRRQGPKEDASLGERECSIARAVLLAADSVGERAVSVG